MEDISGLFEQYQECMRHIWNAYILPLETPQDVGSIQHAYNKAARELFSVLVLGPVQRALPERGTGTHEPLPFLKVTPWYSELSIKINRSQNRSDYWDGPVDRILAGEADLRFVDFFDWDMTGFRDWEYYEVRIVDFPKHPHLAGRNALVPAKDALVYFDSVAG